jgi:hypothetical protein
MKPVAIHRLPGAGIMIRMAWGLLTCMFDRTSPAILMVIASWANPIIHGPSG